MAENRSAAADFTNYTFSGPTSCVLSPVLLLSGKLDEAHKQIFSLLGDVLSTTAMTCPELPVPPCLIFCGWKRYLSCVLVGRAGDYYKTVLAYTCLRSRKLQWRANELQTRPEAIHQLCLGKSPSRVRTTKRHAWSIRQLSLSRLVLSHLNYRRLAS